MFRMTHACDMRVLIIDADLHADHTDRLLKREGFITNWVQSGTEGIAQFEAGWYDIILIDAALSGQDGWDIADRIRRQHSTPMIFLTSRGNISDILKGFHIGADDYIIKPFEDLELVARIRAVLRRASAYKSIIIRMGDLELDPVMRRVTWRNRVIFLSAKEFSLLQFLMSRRGEIVSRSVIFSYVWGVSHGISTNVVDSTVYRLRSKIGAEGGRLIRSVRGLGYVIGPEIQ